MFAYKHKEQFQFKFSFWEEEDGYNSFVYEDEDIDLPNCRPSSYFFGKWLTQLTDMRKVHPKNKLLKHLLSSLWGHLCRSRTITKTYQQIQNEDLDVGDKDNEYEIIDHVYNDDGEDYYKLKISSQPYYYGLGRIKPFLTAKVRNKTATLALKNIDKVIRIHTDNVTFSQPQDISNIEHLYPEDKTTGILEWRVCNRQPERF